VEFRAIPTNIFVPVHVLGVRVYDYDYDYDYDYEDEDDFVSQELPG
jgi:hypothetical protein